MFGNQHYYTELVGAAVVTTIKYLWVHFRARELFETATQRAHHVELTPIRRGYYVDTSETKLRRISTSFPRTFSM